MVDSSRTGSSAASLDEAVRAVRVNSRRRQVLDAAVTVMQHTGFHQMSMQALADEAKVSVGLIYKYFGGKEDILLATIVDILHAFRDRLSSTMESAGDDPVVRLSAMFRRYVEIVDENRDAVVLTYRESRTLDAQGREKIKELKVETSQPLRDALTAGIDAGVFRDVDVDLVAFDLLIIAHGWALKHWHFAPAYDVEQYIAAQTDLMLRGLEMPSDVRRD